MLELVFSEIKYLTHVHGSWTTHGHHQVVGCIFHCTLHRVCFRRL
ncbi:hypothetical protein M8C21_012963 [Ambrosia artemisiifolia]|uniref:Uncharacterized protein n=1 Tax=Ambrosia artemisiifolia TaxID=4212 RepID=A0AAD5CAE4_AMBAR|nr:hypothetical protein M8C21_012963 [Ambrosia artemisiifolia]